MNSDMKGKSNKSFPLQIAFGHVFYRSNNSPKTLLYTNNMNLLRESRKIIPEYENSGAYRQNDKGHKFEGGAPGQSTSQGKEDPKGHEDQHVLLLKSSLNSHI